MFQRTVSVKSFVTLSLVIVPYLAVQVVSMVFLAVALPPGPILDIAAPNMMFPLLAIILVCCLSY